MSRPIDRLIGWLNNYLKDWGVRDDVAAEWAAFCINPTEESLDALRARLDEMGVANDYFQRSVDQHWEEYRALVNGHPGTGVQAVQPGSMQLVYRLMLPDEAGYEFLAPARPDVEDLPFRSKEVGTLTDMLTYGEQIAIVTGYPSADIDPFILAGLRVHARENGKKLVHARAAADMGKAIGDEFVRSGPADILVLEWHQDMVVDNDLINVIQYGLLPDPFKRLVFLMKPDRFTSNVNFATRIKPFMNRVSNGEPYEIPAIGLLPKLMNVPQAARYLFGGELMPHHFGMAHQAQSYVPLMTPYLEWIKAIVERNLGKGALDEIVLRAARIKSDEISRDIGAPVSLINHVMFGNLSRSDKVREPQDAFEAFSVSSGSKPSKDPEKGGSGRETMSGVPRARESVDPMTLGAVELCGFGAGALVSLPVPGI